MVALNGEIMRTGDDLGLGLDPSKPNTGKRDVRLVVISGIFAVLAAAAGGVVTTYHTWSSSASNVCKISLHITAPKAGTHVNGSSGVVVQGTACGMNNKSGWLFDYDPQNQYYYMDTRTPTVSGNGSWAYEDKPIGSVGDQDQAYGLVIIEADQACAKVLEAARPDSQGDVKFRTFPAGCTLDDTNDVLVTYS